MSTRYVWNKCNIKYPEPTWENAGADAIQGDEAVFSNGKASSSFQPVLYKGTSSWSTTRVVVQPDGETSDITGSGGTNPSATKYPYAFGVSLFAKKPDTLSDAFWWLDSKTTSSSGNNIRIIRISKGSYSNYYEYYTGSISLSDISKGSIVAKVSSDSNQSYPTNSYKEPNKGQTLSEWYEYLGSDDIDPISVTYSDARPGKSLTITVNPRSNTYGGTISYLYQYKVNGGAWTDIQTTTATSIDFTVPANAKTVQFRVRAQDNMGFTSTTYVAGASVIVERLNAWIGVNGKARKGVELYVGVNGKARKVTAAYIGVNGKARRFL